MHGRIFQPCVYIVTNERNRTLYIGVTSDLVKRIYQHKHEYFEGFSKEYSTKILVYYEVHDSMDNAITREKQIKNWKRNWKKDLIETENPEWNDLYDEIIQFTWIPCRSTEGRNYIFSEKYLTSK